MIRQKRRESFFTFVLFCFYLFIFCFVLIFCLNLGRNIQNERIIYIIQTFITIFYSAILIADMEAKNLRFFRYKFFPFLWIPTFCSILWVISSTCGTHPYQTFLPRRKRKVEGQITENTPTPLYINFFISNNFNFFISNNSNI